MINIDVNENCFEKLLGIYNPILDIEIDLINFINLCVKNYFRENTNKPMYLTVFIEQLKTYAKSIREIKLQERFNDLMLL